MKLLLAYATAVSFCAVFGRSLEMVKVLDRTKHDPNMMQDINTVATVEFLETSRHEDSRFTLRVIF